MSEADPGAELLEVYTPAGEPTGIIKRRAAVHADGDWHVAAFVWVFDARGRVLLQRRSPDKDVWPGRWDASAAGHVLAGERIEEAARRELFEELGLSLPIASLSGGGAAWHHEEHAHANGLVDREHHAVFFARCDQPLEAYRPGPEVTALAFVDADVLASRAEILDAWMRERDSTDAITRDALVPYHAAYLSSIAAVVARGALGSLRRGR